jgi:quercetin 2,3-dioxygenase
MWTVILLDDLVATGKTAGFGDHPHRGQETLTLITEGELVHQDSNGAKGTLNVGDVQVMRAGKGKKSTVHFPDSHL